MAFLSLSLTTYTIPEVDQKWTCQAPDKLNIKVRIKEEPSAGQDLWHSDQATAAAILHEAGAGNKNWSSTELHFPSDQDSGLASSVANHSERYLGSASGKGKPNASSASSSISCSSRCYGNCPISAP